MWMHRAVIALAILLSLGAGAGAQEFKVEEVASAAQLSADQIKPKTIAFSDHRNDKLAEAGAGVQRFPDWAKSNPLQRQFLTLYPGYSEPTINVTLRGVVQKAKEKLYVYVAEARFVLNKPATSLDLGKYATLATLEKLDPAIKHKLITPADAMPLKDQKSANNRNPDRAWCEGRANSICIQSRYQLEGKLPMGIMLANKLRESEKRIADYIEFQSELALLAPQEIDQAGLGKLTGIEAPIAAVLEQNIFYVNQVMPFGKFLAVFQPNPADPNKTIATMFMALGVDAGLFDKKKEYEQVPVLRNLVPAQLLTGNSSFNTGSSISAGLPVYARTRIQTIAAMLDRD
jgi:hypothetical protein